MLLQITRNKKSACNHLKLITRNKSLIPTEEAGPHPPLCLYRSPERTNQSEDEMRAVQVVAACSVTSRWH